MTVKELIAHLQTFDESLIVVHEGYNDDGETMDYVYDTDTEIVGKYLLLFSTMGGQFKYTELAVESYLAENEI